jgi:hypothetical protein
MVSPCWNDVSFEAGVSESAIFLGGRIGRATGLGVGVRPGAGRGRGGACLGIGVTGDLARGWYPGASP